MNAAYYYYYGENVIKFVALRGDDIVAEADTHEDLVRVLGEKGLDIAEVVFATREVNLHSAESEMAKGRSSE